VLRALSIKTQDSSEGLFCFCFGGSVTILVEYYLLFSRRALGCGNLHTEKKLEERRER
jgi:hypothetical protein